MSRANEESSSHAHLRFVFVVGAPRCGTTALSRYLREHPSICFSKPKEPHYFAQHDLTELTGPQLRNRVEQDYLARFFRHREPDGSMLAEGSVTYLYAADQMEPILKMWPNARFIIALRDPMEMLPSLHQRLLFLGDEREPDFSRAWALVEKRRKGEAIPKGCADPRWLDYLAAGQLGRAVEQFFRTVGRERCFISLYDDFAADPAGQYRRILAFLGLPDDGRTDFTRERSSRGFKVGWLQRLLKRPPKVARQLLAAEGYATRTAASVPKRASGLRKRILGLRKRLLKWNTAEAPAVVLPAALRREIRDTFAADVALLSRLIGRDLSHWLQVESAPSAASGEENRLVA